MRYIILLLLCFIMCNNVECNKTQYVRCFAGGGLIYEGHVGATMLSRRNNYWEFFDVDSGRTTVIDGDCDCFLPIP